jgi:hypothetical protein
MARRAKAPPVTNADRVTALVASLDTDEHGVALAGIALTLAEALDAGAGLATAAVARELRATLEALTDDGSDEAEDVLAGLSAPVRDISKPRKGNARS